MTEYSETVAHLKVLTEALDIFQKRSEVRGSLWARSDLAAQIKMVREKTERVEMARQIYRDEEGDPQMLKDAMEDDLLDIINFAVFGIRHLRGDLPS